MQRAFSVSLALILLCGGCGDSAANSVRHEKQKDRLRENVRALLCGDGEALGDREALLKQVIASPLLDGVEIDPGDISDPISQAVDELEKQGGCTPPR